jgi:membrane protein required for colicin V production
MIFGYLDIALGLILVFAAIRGIFRGFVSEFLSMAAIILGLASAVVFSRPLAVALSGRLGGSAWIQVIAFLGLFIVTYLAVKLIEGFLHTGVEKLNLRNLDRVLGFLLGLVEGFLLVSVILIILVIQPFFDTTQLLNDSTIARLLLPILVPATGKLGIPV